MLSNPKILFLNCLGSYFYSIVGYMEKLTTGNSLLHFLSGNSLKFEKLNLNEIQKKYSDNPWGYQPLSIINTTGEIVKIDFHFFDYLKKIFNIKVEKIEMSNNKALLDYLICDNIDYCFHICKVDEFFLKNSQNFYMKNHNKHYLLIKKIDTAQKRIDIIDSEKNNIYTISFEELYQAFYENEFHTKIYYRINCSEFISNVDYRESMQIFLASTHSTNYLMSLLCEMEQMLNSKDIKKEYFYKGYRYTILSKIIPMVEMKKYLFSKYPDENIINLLNILSSLWNELCTFMLHKISHNDFSFLPLQKKISKIYELEDRFNCYIIDNLKNILNNSRISI